MFAERPADMERLRDCFRGALLGAAIGDALGAPLEGRSMRDRSSIASWANNPPQPLRYTDDTHMTMATARSLIERRGLDPDHMAEMLAQQYEREPWRGYGAGPPRVFGEMRPAAAVAEILRRAPDGEVEPRLFISLLRGHATTSEFLELLERVKSLGDADELTVVKVLGNGVEAHRSVATASTRFYVTVTPSQMP